MLVRIRSKDGLFRLTLEASDDMSVLIDKLLEVAPKAEATTITFSNEPRGSEMAADSLRGNSLSDLGISHGHLLYATYKDREETSEASVTANGQSASAAASSSTAASTSATPLTTSKPWQNVVEAPVDQYWESRGGMIPRERDSKFCRHGPKAMCDYCMPLEVSDTDRNGVHGEGGSH